MLRHPPRAMPLRADRPFKKKIIQCEAADVVAEARAAESIGISFQNPLALAMGRFSHTGTLTFVLSPPFVASLGVL